MHEFSYAAPDTLSEALSLFAIHGERARALAGGTDLIVAMRSGRRCPQVVVDLKRIAELSEVKLDKSGLVLGAAASCRAIYMNERIAEIFPAIIDATSLVGGIQIQGRASVGGNLCNAAPSADTVPALIVHNAIANIQGAAGRRQVAVEDFCVAPGQTILSATEVLVSISLPMPPSNSGAAFIRFTPRNEMDIAVVNVAAWVRLDARCATFVAARIALGSVAPKPLFVKGAGDVLIGKPVGDDAIDHAATIAMETARPIDDMRGTIDHRKQLVSVLVRRAISVAVQRARKT